MKSLSFTPLHARLVLVLLAGLVVYTIAVPVQGNVPPGSVKPPAANDAALFATVVTRVAAGDDYYAAMGDEMARRAYPTDSIFNWRVPTLYFLSARLGAAASFGLLALLCAVAMALSVRTLEAGSREPAAVITGVLALVGALLVALAPAMRYQTEPWCGVLLLISALLAARRRWAAAAAWGIGALFIRELAAPFCAGSFALSLAARRWRESAVWAVGGAAYLAFFAWHVREVQSHPFASPAAAGSWLQWGGVPFVMETLQQSNTLLLATPHVFTGVFAALLLASLFAPAAPVAAKTAVWGYVLFFFVFGQQFNDYWGTVPGPVYAVAAGFGVSGLRSLIRRAAIGTG